MAKVKKKFKLAKEGKIVDKQTAEEILIEKSARYAFNKSHSISYAVCSTGGYKKPTTQKNFSYHICTTQMKTRSAPRNI